MKHKQTFITIALLAVTAFLSAPSNTLGQVKSLKVEGFELVGHLPYLQHSKIWESRAWSLSQIFRAVKDDQNAKLIIYAWRNRVPYQERFRNAGAALDGGAAVTLGNEAKSKAITAGGPESRIDVRYRPQAAAAGVEFVIESLISAHSHPDVDQALSDLDRALAVFKDDNAGKWAQQTQKDLRQDKRMEEVEVRLDRLESAPDPTRVFVGGSFSGMTMGRDRDLVSVNGVLRFEGESSLAQFFIGGFSVDETHDDFMAGGRLAPLKLGPVFPFVSLVFGKSYDPVDNLQWEQQLAPGAGIDISANVGRFKFFGAVTASFNGFRIGGGHVESGPAIAGEAGILFSIR